VLAGRLSLLAAVAFAACARAEPAVIHAPPAPVAAPSPAPPPPPAPPPAPEPRKWPPAPPGIKTTFCLEGVLEALDEDACYFLPDAPTKTLLVYLPGLMPPDLESPEKRAVETVVRNAAQRAGIAALVPRGPTRAELAAPGRDDKGMGHYRSWPTGDESYSRHAKRLVGRIEALRRAVEALAGASFERVYLGGSSAGGYFTGYLMLRGDFAADGYAVLSGGSARPMARDLPKRALYVGYGDGDVVGEKAEALAAQVRRAEWSVRVSKLHTGHGARERYLDEAFAFFAAAPAP
jgi:predicted esterase